MKRLETALVVILAASAGPAMAQANSNAAGTVNADSQEMRSVSEHAFNQWDVNSNQRLEGEEFAAGLHEAWGRNNGQVDEAAYSNNWGNWFDSERPPFEEMDEDGDGQLSQEELRTALNDVDLSGPWQGADDGYLTPEEFRRGLTSVSDRDRSGNLDQSEYDQVVAVVGVVVPSDQQAGTGNNTMTSDETNQAATDATTTGQVSTATGTQQAQNTAANTGATAGSDGAIQVGEVIPLDDWDMDTVYRSGWSAEALFDREVYGENGEEIGDVEDLIVGPDGRLLSVVAEVGGFWDIGDTHVSVPWDRVVIREDGTVQIPVTEDTVDDFSVLNVPTMGQIANDVVTELDDVELGPRAWRASEVIGDIARIRGDATSQAAEQTTGQQAAGQTAQSGYMGFGYVDDLIFQDGQIVAAVVDRDAGYGTRGRYAYPFYGYRYGWHPGNRYYNMPYDRAEATAIEPYAEDRLMNDE